MNSEYGWKNHFGLPAFFHERFSTRTGFHYIWKVDEDIEYSPLRFNLDLRLGVAYNWKRYFVGLQMQLNGFSYKKDHSKVDIIDAYARASLGVRF